MKLICSLGRPAFVRDGHASKPSQYRSTRYRFGDFTTQEFDVPLTALAALFRPSRIVALCTDEAVENYKRFEEELDTLMEVEEWDVRPECRRVSIKVPRSESEMQSVIQTIVENVEDGDEVHLDVTFGLRSISYLSFLVATYAEQLKAARIGRLTYIAFEDPAPAADCDPTTRIMDLSYFLRIPQLILAAEGLKRNGDIANLVRTLHAVSPGLVDQSTLRDAESLQRNLDILATRQIASKNNGAKTIRSICNAMDQAAKDSPMLLALSEEVRRHLEPLIPLPGENLSPASLAGLARWYVKHGRLVHATLLMSQSLAYLCTVNILNQRYPMESENTKRPGAVAGIGECVDLAAKRLIGLGNRDLEDKLRKYYGEIDIRNRIAHAYLLPDMEVDNGDPEKVIGSLLEDFQSICEGIAKL